MEANNNQKMREALEKFVRAYGHEKCVHTTLLAEAHEDAKVALSAPPRNCDVGTEKEQSRRFDAYCYAHRTYERGCGDCPLVQATCCEFAWSQMPYNEGGAK